jgi:hypothetical protein
MLRGFAALAMIADHAGRSSLLLPITGGSQFLVSAAEVFVLISGVLVGVIYGKTILKLGPGKALGKVLRRVGKLYLLTISLTLAFIGSAHVFGLWWQADLSNGVTRLLVEVVTLQRTSFLVDIPLLYTLLLLIAAPSLVLLARGLTMQLLAVSWGVWALWQFTSLLDGLRIEGNEVFHLPAWQVIFVSGMVLGYHREAIESRLGRFSAASRGLALAAVFMIVTLLYVAQVANLETLAGNELMYSLGFDKSNVPIGRLFVLGLLLVFAMVTLTLAWRPVSGAAGWLLLPLGQNALTAYSLHLAVVVVATLLYTRAPGEMSDASVALLQVIAVMAVWGALKVEPGLRTAINERLNRRRTKEPLPRAA